MVHQHTQARTQSPYSCILGWPAFAIAGIADPVCRLRLLAAKYAARKLFERSVRLLAEATEGCAGTAYPAYRPAASGFSNLPWCFPVNAPARRVGDRTASTFATARRHPVHDAPGRLWGAVVTLQRTDRPGDRHTHCQPHP